MFGRFILILSLKRLICGKYFTEKGIIETMKKWLMLLLISFVIFLPACEGRDNDIRTEENDGKNAEKTVEEKNQNKKNLDTINAIPERDRYMFTCGTCEGELPAKENITKIAISKILVAASIDNLSMLAVFLGAPGDACFQRLKVPNPPGRGKDIAEGKGVHCDMYPFAGFFVDI